MSTKSTDQFEILTPEAYAQNLAQSFDRLLNILTLLEPSEIESARLPDGWTPKALVAHVAFWDHVQTERMMAAIAGPEAQAQIPWPETDNDTRAAADEAREWDDALAQAKANRARMVAFAAGLTPEILATVYSEGERPFSVARLLEHMSKHVTEHAGELRTFCGSLDRWGRDGMRQFLVRQQANLLDAIGGMSESWLVSEPVEGKWTSRDVLAHVLYWEEFAWAVIETWPNATPADLAHWLAPGENTDQINARLMAEKIDHTLIDLLDWLTTYHRRTLRTFDQMSDDDLRGMGETGFGQDSFTGFLYDMAMHAAEHAAHIWQARPDSR